MRTPAAFAAVAVAAPAPLVVVLFVAALESRRDGSTTSMLEAVYLNISEKNFSAKI